MLKFVNLCNRLTDSAVFLGLVFRNGVFTVLDSRQCSGYLPPLIEWSRLIIHLLWTNVGKKFNPKPFHVRRCWIFNIRKYTQKTIVKYIFSLYILKNQFNVCKCWWIILHLTGSILVRVHIIDPIFYIATALFCWLILICLEPKSSQLLRGLRNASY